MRKRIVLTVFIGFLLASPLVCGQGLAGLVVSAVDPFTGRVYPNARVLVRSLDGKIACSGYKGLAECSLPRGDYHIEAKLSGYGSSKSRISLTEPITYRKVALWIEAPIDYGPIGQFVVEKNILTGRIVTNNVVDSTNGYWIQLSAVHYCFQAMTYVASGEFALQGARPGLYQMTVSSGSISKALLLTMHSKCSDVVIAWDRLPAELDCSK